MTPPSPPTSLERLYKSWDERFSTGRRFEHISERQRQWDAGAEARELDEAARDLPDDLFATDPEIGVLRADCDAKTQRAKRVVGGSFGNSLASAVSGLTGRIQAATEEVRLAAIDDAITGEFEFPRAVEASRRLDHLRSLLDFVRLASLSLSKTPPRVEAEFNEQMLNAKNALAVALLARKREHLRSKASLGGSEDAGATGPLDRTPA